MKELVKNIWLYINLVRSLPAIVSMYASRQRFIIYKDINRWMRIKEPGIMNLKFLELNWLLVTYPEFRNLFYHRIKCDRYFLSLILKFFYKPLSTLYIYTEEIGGGLYIQHGFSTIITAEKIGENCSINQQVTIGYGSHGGKPIIGDNVLISSGAKVFGNIIIDNNSKVGANCVVAKSVPQNCTVVGIPAKIIKKDGKKVDG